MPSANVKNDSTVSATDTVGSVTLAEVSGNLEISTTSTNGVRVGGEVVCAATYGVGVSDGTYKSTFTATSSGTTSYTMDFLQTLPGADSAVVNTGADAFTYHSDGFVNNDNLAIFFGRFLSGTYDDTTNRRYHVDQTVVHSDPLGNISLDSGGYIFTLAPGIYEISATINSTGSGGYLTNSIRNEDTSSQIGHAMVQPTPSSGRAYMLGNAFVVAIELSATTNLCFRDASGDYGFGLTFMRPDSSYFCIRQIM